MAYTKGEWKSWLTETKLKRWTICAGANGALGIAETVLDSHILSAEQEANAYLISAAPELYEACQILLAWSKSFAPNDPVNQKAEKAIAKAEGK